MATWALTGHRGIENSEVTNHSDQTLRQTLRLSHGSEKTPGHLRCSRSSSRLIPSSGGTAEGLHVEIPTELLNKRLKATRPQTPSYQLTFADWLTTWLPRAGSDSHRGRVDRCDVPRYLIMTVDRLLAVEL